MRPTLAELKEYGVLELHFGGCLKGSPIHPGQPAAMRRSAHAHNRRVDPNYGHICFKAVRLENVSTSLIWHEVGHIYRRSWTQAQCDSWAWRMARRQQQ